MFNETYTLAIKIVRNIKRELKTQIIDRPQLKKLKYQIAYISQIKLPDKTETPLQILFNTQYPWSYVAIEYMTAFRLKQRGQQPKLLLCDGVPYCEQQTLTTSKPACSSCFKSSKRMASTFNLPYETINQHLTTQIRHEAQQIAYHLPVNKLRELIIDQIKLGEISYQNLLHFYKGVLPIKKEVEAQYRKMIEAAYLVLKATKSYFEKSQVDVVVSANGKFIQSGICVDYANSINKPYFTWEVFNQFSGTIFGKNTIAFEQRIDDIWDTVKDIPLTTDQLKKLYKNFDAQAKSENTPFKYQEKHYLESKAAIYSQLTLDVNKPIITMFSNVEWDSTAMIESGFKDMFDWLCSGIDYAKIHADVQLIVRAHPGELKVPHDLKTNTPICQRIRDKYSQLPDNVRLIDPLDPISSYALGELSSVIMVYSSTMGIEFALRGIKPWVAAKTYYYGKSFTLDLTSRTDMFFKLDASREKILLTKEEHAYAERFAYIVRYRRLFKFPYFNNGKFQYHEYGTDLTKSNTVIENVCDLIEGRRNAYDLGEANW